MSKTDSILHETELDWGEKWENELESEWSAGMDDEIDYDMEMWKNLTAEQKIALGASPEMVRACEGTTTVMDAEDEMRRMLANVPLHQIYIPNGWTVWMCCNSPGRIYVGPWSAYYHMDGCGSSPALLEWPQALAYLNASTEEDPWALDILGDWDQRR